jgi:predicted GTPase
MRIFCRLLSRKQLDPNIIYGVESVQRVSPPKDVSSQPKNQRSLKVAVIGTPNVGKSALTNLLIKLNLCAVSKVIDTTRQVSYDKNLE